MTAEHKELLEMWCRKKPSALESVVFIKQFFYNVGFFKNVTIVL
jgi:hypothetical protein